MNGRCITGEETIHQVKTQTIFGVGVGGGGWLVGLECDSNIHILPAGSCEYSTSLQMPEDYPALQRAPHQLFLSSREHEGQRE